MMKALVLDATYFPVQIIDWRKAMILFFTDRAEVVDYHDDIEIRSTCETFKLPKVLRLFTKINTLTHVKFNRLNVFHRDKFQCQYCYKKFRESELTLDHVLPRSRGGATNWTNIVASCHDCNNKKGPRTPEECNYKLLNKPVEPKWTPMMAFKLSHLEKILFKDWFFR